VIRDLLLDLRYGARMLRRNLGFTIVAVATLALGIGATTAVFSVVDGVLLRPLPYPQPGRIVAVYEQVNRTFFRNRAADATFIEWREQARSFEAMAQYRSSKESVTGAGEPVQASVTAVSRDFFRALGVGPAAGRAFTEEELRDGGAPAVLVSHAFWQRRLDGATALAGKTLTVGDRVMPVVGVMPPGFDFPAAARDGRTDLWVPREMFPRVASRTAYNWYVIGRLREGVPLAAAQAEITAIARRQRDQYGKDTRTTDATLVPLHEDLVEGVRSALLVLMGAVVFLMCVACANVANLLLAQVAGRRQELAVRAALGAGRGRLLAQMIAESLLLTLLGGVLGVGLAHAGVDALLRFEPGTLPRTNDVGVDGRALLFGLGVSLLASAAFGVLAALRATDRRHELQDDLKEGARAQAGTSRGGRLRAALVAWQIGLTLTLLAGGGLLGRSLLRVLRTDPGFRTEQVLVMKLARPGVGNDQAASRRGARDQQLLARLRALPGVVEVGAANSFPLDRSPGNGAFLIVSDPARLGTLEDFKAMQRTGSPHGNADFRVASEGYFRALGVPLLRGRMFDQRDAAGAPEVAVISTSLARAQWPDEDPIGKHIQYGNMDGDFHPMTIVGVVGDVHTRRLEGPAPPTVYANARQRLRSVAALTVVMRASGDPVALVAAAREIARELEPAAPPTFRSAEDFVTSAVGQRRFLLLLVGVFALSALALAAFGIYGVTAFSVATRTQEIGVRMALGARPGDVLRLVLGQGARQVLAGIALGGLGALALTRVLRGLLYGVTAADPLTYACVVALLVIVALAALYFPARRAAKVDPMVALRSR
jgi:predicted permease